METGTGTGNRKQVSRRNSPVGLLGLQAEVVRVSHLRCGISGHLHGNFKDGLHLKKLANKTPLKLNLFLIDSVRW